MKFKELFVDFIAGTPIKRKVWEGYWVYKYGEILMYTKSGEVIDFLDTEDILFTLSGILQDDWEIAKQIRRSSMETITMNFGITLHHLKQGYKAARKGWNGKDMFVVYQKGYPDGIESNKQTADAWGLNEGDLFKVEPYLQIKMQNNSHSMWVPSINDILAEDWYLVD